MTSITAFGQEGPYKDYKAPDIVTLAMSGGLFGVGDPDRPPLRISFPQAFLFVSGQAAAGTMIALYYQGITGEGQHLDVSAQHSLEILQINALPFWEVNKVILRRQGPFRAGLSGGGVQHQIWPCKDGFIFFIIMGGAAGKRSNRLLCEWMKEEGFSRVFLEQWDWDSLDMSKVNQEIMDKLEEPMGKFFLAHSKVELYEGALDRGIMLYPVYTPEEILNDVQLQARDFWVDIEHPELGGTITCPGSFIKLSEASCGVWRRAPLIGEHNEEIYLELGLPREELSILKQSKVI